MSWSERTLLWDPRVGCREAVYASDFTAATFDPESIGTGFGGGGTLSNGNRTINSGSAASTSAVYPYDSPPRPAPYAAEFTIDVGHASQRIVVFPTFSVPVSSYATPGFMYEASGYVYPGYTTLDGFTTNDKVGLVVYGPGNAAVFKNGVLVHASYVHYYAPRPHRFGVQSSGGQVTVECSIDAMTYADAYRAFVSPAVWNGPSMAADSWPI